MASNIVEARWNEVEKTLDLSMDRAKFEELNMYQTLHGNGGMLMAILGCGQCEERVDAVKRMPVSQVERPWFVGKMADDPVLIRLKCEYLRWMMLGAGGKEKFPPCMRLRQLFRAQEVPGLECVPDGSIVAVRDKEE